MPPTPPLVILRMAPESAHLPMRCVSIAVWTFYSMPVHAATCSEAVILSYSRKLQPCDKNM